MEKLNVAYSYLSLEKAGTLLEISAIDLIHAGAFDQVQICVNIYARAEGLSRERIDLTLGSNYVDIDVNARLKAQAHLEKFGDWGDRLKNNPMPSGIFEVTQDDLRLFEMPETKSVGLYEAFKSDELGLWDVRFDPADGGNSQDRPQNLLLALSERTQSYSSTENCR